MEPLFAWNSLRYSNPLLYTGHSEGDSGQTTQGREKQKKSRILNAYSMTVYFT